MSNFTKGEWVISKQSKTLVELKGGIRSICSTGGFNDGTDNIHDENEANANLIASAPDLLKSLIDLLNAKTGELNFAKVMARKAIKKATL